MGTKEVKSRPEWDDLFMTLAFIISQRSLDPHTKHGTVVVGENKSILSVGFNSPPRGCVDSDIPLTRPHKYRYFAHSEENAIANAAANGISLRNSTFYITGFPCPTCFRMIKNCGAKQIIYGSIESKCISKEDVQAINIMLSNNGRLPNIIFTEYRNANGLFNLLDTTRNYAADKIHKLYNMKKGE